MFKIRLVRAALSLAIILPCFASARLSHAATEVKLEDILSGYLASIGNPAARSAVKSRVVEGTTQFNVLTGGAGKATDGTSAIVSDGRKVQLMMKFPNSNYHGERFICDGNKVSVATATDAQTRSNFGNFVYIQDIVLREGLLGGELSTAWPLLDLEQRKAKLSYEGLKTIDGKQLHEVKYKPKKGQDVEIYLYFDPESYHHVLTVYKLSIRPQLAQGGQQNPLAVPELGGGRGSSPLQGTVSPDAAQAGAQQETRYTVEERFSEFKAADGLTLPNHYTIHFMQEPQGGNTTILDWDTSANRILENVTLDPRNFQVK
ncbi:MAG TPA: hypothetical protein VMT28_05480 [Terriglobales bacterium]|jgi:hypothetical protein|nr:hypothetical protein [Terriglobales bacterium]